MAQAELRTIAVSKIVPSPFQPRESFDKEGLEELADSMKSVDVLQPIIVRPKDGGFQIAAGERRWRAAQMAGWKEVPAIVREMDDPTLQLYSIVENLHRLDLQANEKEKAIHDLWAKYYEPKNKSRTQLAKDLGLSESSVNRLIASYGDRAALKSAAVRKSVTTEDLHVTRGLEEPVRKELLEKKAKGEIAQKDLADIASLAKVAPPGKQETIVEQFVRETTKARERIETIMEEAKDYAKGRESVQLSVGPDERRLRRMFDVYKDVRMMTVAYINMIKTDSLRWKAVDVLEKTRDHCDNVLRQLEKQKWYKEG